MCGLDVVVGFVGCDVVGCCWELLGVVGCHWMSLDAVECCWLLLVVVGCCWVLLDLDHAEAFWRILLDVVG